MRVTAAFHRLLGLSGIAVRGVSFPDAGSDAHTVVVEVGLRRKRLACPLCGFTTRARYDTRPVSSTWRHLDFGRWRVQLRAGLRRGCCPTHGVRVEAVPFARHRSGFTAARCSSDPSTSPTTSRARCASCAAAVGTCGGPPRPVNG